MKLNADIIYYGLKKKFGQVFISGPRSQELTLGRPEFYMEDEAFFRTGCLYLATVEHLPARPRISRNSVLVCIGENTRMKYYSERLCLITIRKKADFFRVFQALQDIFDEYDEWERTLYRILMQDGDIHSLLSASKHIFRHNLLAIDAAFRIISSTYENETPYWNEDVGKPLNIDKLSSFLASSDLMTEKKGALHIDHEQNRALCVNLFDRTDQYEGCLVIILETDPFEPGYDPLAVFLADILQNAVIDRRHAGNDKKASMKSVFRTLFEEQPIVPSQRLLLNAANHRTEYICIYMDYSGRTNRIPSGYICDTMEDAFDNAYALDSDNGIVCFAEKTEELIAELPEFVSAMKVSAGISDSFSDIFTLRTYYTQALSALENGQLMNPSGRVFFFADYALVTMIINATGNLPAEAYFSGGLRKIISHDQSSGVSYSETLKVFLEENLSYTSAAKKLYIHRSTLIDRITRIEKELGIDLHDSQQRLLLEIILKAVEIEKKINAE